MQKFFSHILEYLKWYVLITMAIISLVLLFALIHEDRGGILKISFLNIGQGDSIFIESPTGTQVLVDGGPNNNLMKEISKVLPWYDRHIDMLVITNTDKDHFEGFIPLLKKYTTDIVLEPGTLNKTGAYEILENEIKNKKIVEIVPRRGERVELGAGAYLEILFPDRDVSGLNTNDGSLVMRLVYGDTSVLLEGDSPVNIEHYLVGIGGDLKSMILKAGHHGSRTSTSEEYVKAVMPEWVVISAGKDNSYGHPHKETLDTLNNLKIPTLATCSIGRITFESNGKEFVLKNKTIKPAIVGCK